MEIAEREEFKEALVSLLGEIIQKAVQREEVAVMSQPGGMDLMQLAVERELAVRKIESDFNKLQNIRQALCRIKDGTYGTCLCCGREIGVKHLRSIPWASYCVTCQSTADRESRQANGDLYVQYV